MPDESSVQACRHCFASILTDRAIVYRIDPAYAPRSSAQVHGGPAFETSDHGAVLAFCWPPWHL